ncbi:hypothetical protein H0H92_015046 [Tricholoma furcatifolium]|nr:hypothetical protein H0H92_015046 [Tricholoma furcatifolium]
MPFGTVKLNDGNEIPAIGFGSGSVNKGRDATDLVARAIESGFSHIDTAQAYQNEESVGVAIRESGLARDALFVTTKYKSGGYREAFNESLHKLGLKYVDLYLIHTPGFVAPDFEGSWRALEQFKEEGLTKSIGVSNFEVEHLQTIIKIAKIKPAVNQIEFHPYTYAKNKPLLEYAAKHGIVIEGYSSLAPITKYPGGPVDAPINAIVKRLGITPNQVIFAWVKAKGVVIVTTSSRKERLEEYLAVGDLPPLSDEDIAAIDEAGAKGPAGATINVQRRTALICAAAAFMYTVFAIASVSNVVQVVDFAPFLNGADRKSTAAAILQSFQTTGFVCLVNHGFPDHIIEDMFNWSKKFFALSEEEKMLAPHPPSGAHHRGYSPPALEKVLRNPSEVATNRAKAQDVKESFESGREEDEAMPNIWLPEHVLPGFKEACLDFFWKCFGLEKTILKALAVGLNVPEDYFAPYHTKPDNQLRLLRYPSVPLKALESNQISRIDGHADFGSITILFQDDVGGLEVEDPNNPGSFLPVPPVPGSIIINAGDMLMRWSNDTIRSTVHRVRAPAGAASTDGMVPERYSIPYFCCPDFATVVDAIPGTWSDERPKRYEPTSARDYVVKRLAANY